MSGWMCLYGCMYVDWWVGWSEESSRVESSVTMPPGTVEDRQTIEYTKTGERDKQAGLRGWVGMGQDGTGRDGKGTS